MIPLPIMSLWLKWRWALLGALCLGLYVGGYWQGYKGCQNASYKSLEKQATKAVQKAAVDTTRLNELEKENEALLERLEAIPDRQLCSPSADELRLLQDIANSTK